MAYAWDIQACSDKLFIGTSHDVLIYTDLRKDCIIIMLKAVSDDNSKFGFVNIHKIKMG